MKKTAAKGHTRKHAHATHKHHHTLKHHPVHHHEKAKAHGHNVHTKAKHPAHAKARSLTLSGVGCCGAEALAASLQLAGASVTSADVLALHRLAGADDETGAPIAVLLEAAAEYGLAGYRPRFQPAPAQDIFEVADGVLDQLVVAGKGLAAVGAVHGRKDSGLAGVQLARFGLAGFRPAFAPALPQRGYEAVGEAACKKSSCEPPEFRPGHALILGVDLPGPHAVLAAAGRWWSWGELHCPCEFPDAVVEEAWLVSWEGPAGRGFEPRSLRSQAASRSADCGLPHGALSVGLPAGPVVSIGGRWAA